MTPIYLNKHMFHVYLCNYRGKLKPFSVKKMFFESEIQKRLNCKKLHFNFKDHVKNRENIHSAV